MDRLIGQARLINLKNKQVKMVSHYCVKCKKVVEMSNVKLGRMKNGRYRLTGLSPCGGKMSKIISALEAAKYK